MTRESIKRDVLQLLWEYQPWKAAFGSARPLDEQHIAQATYGPAGFVATGAAYHEYTQEQRDRLAQSYRALDDALDILKGHGPLGFTAWSVLHRAYLRDEADPSIVMRWRDWVRHWEENRKRLEDADEAAYIAWIDRRPYTNSPSRRKWRESKPTPRTVKWLQTHYRPQNAEWHDLGVGQLGYYLRETKLYPIEPKRLSESEDKSIENKNAEMYANFQRLRSSGLRERDAAAEAAKDANVTTEYVERIIEFRDTLKPQTCIEASCDKPVYQQNRCSRHYQQDLKRRKGKAS